MDSYSLFTGRLLRLAPPASEDRSAFARWTLDANYQRMLEDDPIRPLSVEQAGMFGGGVSQDSFDFRLRTLTDDTLIGFIVLFNINRTYAVDRG